MSWGFDFRLFFDSFRNLDAGWMAASAVLVLATYAGRALRWQAMMRPVAPHAPLWRLIENTCIGFTAGVIFGRAAEIVRPLLIARAEGVTLASQVAVWVLERVTDLVMVLLLFGIALSAVDRSRAVEVGPEVAWVLQFGGRASLGLGGVAAGALLACRMFSGDAPRWLSQWPKVAGFADSLATGVAATRDAKALALVLVYTLAEWALIGACYYCIFKGFAPTQHLTAMDSLTILGFVSFASVVQIPGVGGGVQVAAALVLTQLFGIAAEPAVTAGILFWGIGFAAIVPVGSFFALRRGLTFAGLRGLGRETKGTA